MTIKITLRIPQRTSCSGADAFVVGKTAQETDSQNKTRNNPGEENQDGHHRFDDDIEQGFEKPFLPGFHHILNLDAERRRDRLRRNRRSRRSLRCRIRRRIIRLKLLQNGNGTAVERRHKRRIRVDGHNNIVCRDRNAINRSDHRLSFDARRTNLSSLRVRVPSSKTEKSRQREPKMLLPEKFYHLISSSFFLRSCRICKN